MAAHPLPPLRPHTRRWRERRRDLAAPYRGALGVHHPGRCVCMAAAIIPPSTAMSPAKARVYH
eukprot:5344825-Prymnesium_polylepis.1